MIDAGLHELESNTSRGGPSPLAVVVGAALQFAFCASQLVILIAIERQLELTNSTFRALFPWLGAAFAVHYWLPRRLQLWLFLAASIFGTVALLGYGPVHWDARAALTGGAALIGVGTSLVLVCRLSIPYWSRVAALIAAAALLGTGRYLHVGGDTLAAFWPILGSMFMFRLVLYVYELKHASNLPSLGRSLAYFFMLPNVCFPLYPVIDWKTFERQYFDEDAAKLYQTGLHWMARGLVQLALYRVVLHHFYIDPTRVADGRSLASFVFSNYGLYLHVSGQFHLIVGVLYLFGWRLPQSNHHYYLAESFTDYWRRINIYWKDFMQKACYNPVAYRLKGKGPTTAVMVGCVAAFAATWALHWYQTFWLLGEFRISSQDGAFWAILGTLVVLNAGWEASHPRARRSMTGLDLRRSTAVAMRTGGMFAVLCVLWSLWSSDSWAQWCGLWRYVDSAFLVCASVVIAPIVACKLAVHLAASFRGSVFSERRRNEHRIASSFRPAAVGCVVLPALIWLSSSERVRDITPTSLVPLLSALSPVQNTDRSALAPPRGYYELLINADRPQAPSQD